MADNQKNELNEQQILSFLQDIVGKIRTEEDPFELNKYRRLFRKAIPFTLRAYFAAYLLKQIDSGNPVTKLGTSPRNDRSLKNGRMDRSRSGRNESRNENRKGSVEPKNDAVSGRRGQTNGEIAGTDRGTPLETNPECLSRKICRPRCSSASDATVACIPGISFH